MGLLLFAEYKRYSLNPACMHPFRQSLSNIVIPYRNLIPSKKFRMIGKNEGEMWQSKRLKVTLFNLKDMFKNNSIYGIRL